MPYESLRRLPGAAPAGGDTPPGATRGNDVVAFTPLDDDEAIAIPGAPEAAIEEGGTAHAGESTASAGVQTDEPGQERLVLVPAHESGIAPVSEAEVDRRLQLALRRIPDPSADLHGFVRALLDATPAEIETQAPDDVCSIALYRPSFGMSASEQLFAGTIGSFEDGQFRFDRALVSMSPDLSSLSSISVKPEDLVIISLPRVAHDALRATLLEAYRAQVDAVAQQQQAMVEGRALGAPAMAAQLIAQQMARFNEVGRREVLRGGESVWDVPVSLTVVASQHYDEGSGEYYYRHDIGEESTQLAILNDEVVRVGEYAGTVVQTEPIGQVVQAEETAIETLDTTVEPLAAARAVPQMSLDHAIRSLFTDDGADAAAVVATVRTSTRVVAPDAETARAVASAMAAERLTNYLDMQRVTPVHVEAYRPQEGDEPQAPRG